MDKRQELIKKIKLLLQEVDKAKLQVSEEKISYLERYRIWMESVLQKLQDGRMTESNGRLIGCMRGISEYDDLARIKELYDAAADVDCFYSKECKEW